MLLQQAHHCVLRLQRQIEDIEAQVTGRLVREAQNLKSGLSAAELQFGLLCRSRLRERRHALEKELSEALAVHTARAEMFREARRKREAIETLRQRQFQVYCRESARRDQRQLDDLFLLRRRSPDVCR